MDERESIAEIKERLVRIEVMLEQLNGNNDLKLQAIEEKVKVANNRIADLEDTNKWLWRAILGTVISAVIALIINIK